MSGYVVSSDVKDDLDAIWEYIAASSPNAADTLISKIVDAFNGLGRNPYIGRKREDLTSRAVLFWPMDNYLILYRVGDRTVEIIGVTHGARDIPALMSYRIF